MSARGSVRAIGDPAAAGVSDLSMFRLIRELEQRARALPPETPLPSGLDAGDLVTHAIRRSVAGHLANAPGVVLGEDPEALHQARVATRRLRSDLRTFEPLLDSDWSRSLRADLSVLAGVLGAVRDWDVLTLRFEEAAGTLPSREGVDLVLAGLTEVRAEERSSLLTYMASSQYASVLDRLGEAARHPALGPGARRPVGKLNRLMRAPWRRLSRAVGRLPAEPSPPDLHEIRIRAKRARYAAEAIEPGFGRPTRRFAKRARRLQDALGLHQDAAVAYEWLSRWAASQDDQHGAFAAGELAGLELATLSRTRAAWRETWRDLDRSKHTAWIG